MKENYTQCTLRLDEFIIKWCGVNSSHLIDNDENDGQRLRNFIKTQIDEAKEEGRREAEELCSCPPRQHIHL